MKVVILGALSGIAVEIARTYAARGAEFGLLDLSDEGLVRLADDLRVRGAGKVKTQAMDLSAPASYEGTLRAFADELGGIDVLVLAYGILGDQARARADLDHAATILKIDFTSAALWLLAAANTVNPKGSIAVFSSVAGDRGRKSNFVYGAAKGGLAVLAQGLAHDCAATGPHFVIAKPGFVITPMTEAMKRGGPLWTSAERVAQIVVSAIDKKRGPIVYVPWFWRWIMLIIRLVPSPIFHRTNL